MPTGIPRTHAWPHTQPRTLTSRSRPCLLWTPLRTGRGGRDAEGRAYANTPPPWRWELRVELWPAAASQTTRPAPAKDKQPMECRLEGVVMRSSARIPRVEISRHLFRLWWWVCSGPTSFAICSFLGCSPQFLYHLWLFHHDISTYHKMP